MFISHALPYRAGIPLRTQPYFPLVPARAAGRPNSARYPKAGPPELRSAGMRIPANRSPTASRTTGDDRTTGLRTQCSGIFSGSAPFRPAPAFRQNRQAATFLRSQRCPQAIGFRPEIPILVTLRVVQPRERLQTPQEIGIVPFASRPSPFGESRQSGQQHILGMVERRNEFGPQVALHAQNPARLLCVQAVRNGRKPPKASGSVSRLP